MYSLAWVVCVVAYFTRIQRMWSPEHIKQPYSILGRIIVTFEHLRSNVCFVTSVFPPECICSCSLHKIQKIKCGFLFSISHHTRLNEQMTFLYLTDLIIISNLSARIKCTSWVLHFCRSSSVKNASPLHFSLSCESCHVRALLLRDKRSTVCTFHMVCYRSV